MGNHNVLITNPKGDRKEHFVENVTKRECDKWLEEYGPAPIGWHYQIVNHNKKPRRYPEYTLVQGFKLDGKLVDQRKAHVKLNNGEWYTLRKAKRDARARGAVYFTREKIWDSKEDSPF